MYTPSRQLFFPVPLIDDADRLLFGSGKNGITCNPSRNTFRIRQRRVQTSPLLLSTLDSRAKALFFLEDYWRVM
jgi:hypothetical protein